MYNCIQSNRRLQYTAHGGGLYAIQLEFLYPRILLISDGRIFFKQHAVQRHVNRSDLRLLTEITLSIL